jgi:hypothetical protein
MTSGINRMKKKEQLEEEEKENLKKHEDEKLKRLI